MILCIVISIPETDLHTTPKPRCGCSRALLLKRTCPSALCHGPNPKSLTSSFLHAILLQNTLFSQTSQGRCCQL